MTVYGLTMSKADRQSFHSWESQTQRTRSAQAKRFPRIWRPVLRTVTQNRLRNRGSKGEVTGKRHRRAAGILKADFRTLMPEEYRCARDLYT